MHLDRPQSVLLFNNFFMVPYCWAPNCELYWRILLPTTKKTEGEQINYPQQTPRARSFVCTDIIEQRLATEGNFKIEGN